jgi:hypothetical protein
MAFGVHDHPFYRPLWVRLALIAVTGGWAAFEIFVTGQEMWTIIAVAAFLYCLWAFFIAWKPDAPPPA